MSSPKQLSRIFGERTLIEETVARLEGLFDASHIIVVTNAEYQVRIRELLSDVPPENILGEPALRDTAPCIAMAAAYIESICEDAVMCVLPSDHVINAAADFRRVLGECIDYACGSASIVTVGICPSYPATGYGYIETGDTVREGFTVFRGVLAFKEKPDFETAEGYISSGRYKWNGGMFVMSLSTIDLAFERCDFELDVFRRRLLVIFKGGVGSLSEEYGKVKRISIDYAVMEKFGDIVVAESRFDWDDAGSWSAFRNQFKSDISGNVSRGLFKGLDVKDCITASSGDHLIAAIGVEGLTIVHTDDVTFVCPVTELQRIKELLRGISSDGELKKFL